MKKKASRGGRRPGAGRKPDNPEIGSRVKTSVRIQADHYDQLKAAPGGWSRYIDTGLEITIPALGHTPGTEACLIAYHAISEAIQRLERIRDYNPETGMEDDGVYWNAEHRALHATLSHMWDVLRQSPLFFEPKHLWCNPQKSDTFAPGF